MMLTLLTLVSLSTAVVFAGSNCPRRELIYPCACYKVTLRKNVFHTIVACHWIKNVQKFNEIVRSLEGVEIDQLYIYDSLWEVQAHEDNQRNFYEDWINFLNVKEIQIEDTLLTNSFRCNANLNCKKNAIKRLAVINSTSSDIQNSCNGQGQNIITAWAKCFSGLQEVQFSRGSIRVLQGALFPIPMDKLLTLNLSRNQIWRLDKDALKNLKNLISLDLSHNAIRNIINGFPGLETKLQFLDLSWNQLITFPSEMLRSFPKLKHFNLEGNKMEKLDRGPWSYTPNSLRTITLNNNPIRCDCGIQWVNSTFSINVNIIGRCASPENYQNSQIRRASIAMNERCYHGVLGTRRPRNQNRNEIP